MLTTSALRLRCTPIIANVTRHMLRASTLSQGLSNLRYSTTASAAETKDEQSAPIRKIVTLKRKKRSSESNETKTKTSAVPYKNQLSKKSGADDLNMADTRRVSDMKISLRLAQAELNTLHRRRRELQSTPRGQYKVGAKFSLPTKDNEVTVKDSTVFVAKRAVPNIWLRDNCQCATCMHDATRQRLLDTFSIPKDIAIKEHAFEEDDSVLKIEWSDGHTSRYSCSLLGKVANKKYVKAIQRLGMVRISLWDSSIVSSPPVVSYETVMNDELSGMLKHLREYGFCYVDNTPFEDPQDTKKLLEKIAFIRETHYGGFYDFTADLASKDTAYTNIALEAHTDTTYFSDPAGLQAFHLLSHTDGEGGASLLVDGFKAADELLRTDPKAYEILATTNVHGHASGNDGISIQPYRGFPVLEHDVATGDLLRVRWNSSDRASIELPIYQVETWYDAARKFDALLKKKENEYWEQLKPGRVLIFDNWRVLHGRSSFTGKRRICGAYINRDDWISRFKMTEFGQNKVLEGLAVN